MAKEAGSKKKEQAIDEKTQGFRELVRALFFCVLIVVVVRSFVFEPFKIPSSSMVPTLRIGDHIFVSKYNYGLSIPFTKIELVRWKQPERGDIVVFLFPKDETLHYIKRVVGVPGDKIELRETKIVINGEELQRKLIPEQPQSGALYQETLDGRHYFVRYSREGTARYVRKTFEKTFVVPEDAFFVLGDNRDDSYDSRSWGMVQRSAIKGKAQFVWLSLDPKEAWGTVKKVRWDRSFSRIY